MEKMKLPEHIEARLNVVMLALSEELSSEYESYVDAESSLSEIEHEARDGFFPYTNGGIDITIPVNLEQIESAGKYPVNDKVTQELRRVIGNDYDIALELFCDQNKQALSKHYSVEQLEQHDNKVINYTDLCDKGLDTLADLLSGYETDAVSEGGTFFIQCRAIYYSADNSHNETGEDEIYFMSGVNLDFEYGREKGLETIYERTIKAFDLTPSLINETIAAMETAI